jgi:hypothetical protein
MTLTAMARCRWEPGRIPQQSEREKKGDVTVDSYETSDRNDFSCMSLTRQNLTWEYYPR